MQIPKNVIQTGETDLDHKIYIEDYVHTLFMQYKDKEADFCLYGRKETEGEISYYFLYGAAVEEAGWEIMENRYFPGQQRVGEATFSGKEKWLFFEDGYASPLDGYFIFYEQNEDMQSYLIAMHQNRPGEKTVEIRPRAARRTEERAQDENVSDMEKEPRRIRRSPMVYDLKQDGTDGEEPRRESRQEWQTSEKALHAAGIHQRHNRRERPERTGSGRKGQAAPFPGRMAGAAVLLVLCAIGITTLGGYQDMEEVGNFFAEAVRELDGGETEEAGLVVEEIQAGEENQMAGADQAEMTPYPAETAPDQAGTVPVLAMEAGTQEAALGPETPEGDGAAAVQSSENLQAESIAEQADTGTIQAAETQAAGMQEETDQAAAAQEGTTQRASEQESASGEAEQQTGDAAEESANAGKEAPADTSPVSMTSYVVQSGDSLAAICRRQYGNIDRMDEIVALNGITDPNHLIPGQKIILPN